LTGWRIDIKSETQANETNFLAEAPVEVAEAVVDAVEAVDEELTEE